MNTLQQVNLNHNRLNTLPLKKVLVNWSGNDVYIGLAGNPLATLAAVGVDDCLSSHRITVYLYNTGSWLCDARLSWMIGPHTYCSHEMNPSQAVVFPPCLCVDDFSSRIMMCASWSGAVEKPVPG